MKPITVTQLNDYVNDILRKDIVVNNVAVKGEVTGVKYHHNGQIYFNLKDERCRVNCYIPRNRVSEMDFVLEDDCEVIVTGSAGIYAPSGGYTFTVSTIEVSGIGELAIAFEKMKEKLQKEGLFDGEKKELPFFPKTVGVITSNTGAAIRDIISIITEKNDYCDVILFPSQVQGMGAAEQIAANIDYVNKNRKDVDVLIVGRGGGSPEDLWAFNEEVVARSIFASEIPIISAVGHEIDYTISDMVADRRAETPTAAAQMAVPDTRELRGEIEYIREDMLNQLNKAAMVAGLKAEKVMSGMKESILRRIDSGRAEIDNLKVQIKENDPRKILESGYSIIETSKGKPVTSPESLNEDDSYKITLRDGSVTAGLKDVRKSGER